MDTKAFERWLITAPKIVARAKDDKRIAQTHVDSLSVKIDQIAEKVTLLNETEGAITQLKLAGETHVLIRKFIAEAEARFSLKIPSV